MILVHVAHSYYPVLGGIERAVQKMAEHQIELGHEVHIITSHYGAENRAFKEELNSVHIHRVKAWRLHYPDLTIPRESCESLLREANVIHVHGQNSLFNILLAKRAKRMGRCIVMDFLALDYLKLHLNPIIRLFGSCYQERIQHEAAKFVDEAITLNERDQRLLKEKYEVESTVIPHGIDESYLMKPKDEKLFREKYNVYEENVMAYVGRIHPSKGLDVLVKALPLITSKVNNFVAVIAGGGSEAYRRHLLMLAKKLKVEDRVRILGYINEDEKISLLDASRVFVFPTRHFGEAYPLVIDEAYAREIPIVTTGVGAMPYRVKHMETGILIPTDDPSSLSRAVVTLLKDDDLLANMHRQLRSIKKSLLTWRQVCLRLNKIYDDAMKVSQAG
jgi:glycosyltransferase involved in cell wall biosynthesis